MNITIKSHHVNITGALKEYAHKKLEKVLKYFDNIQDVILEMDIRDNSDEDSRQFAAAIVHASQTVIRAEQASRDMYAAIDVVVEKLSQQLKKHKEKLRDHNRKPSAKIIGGESDTTSQKLAKPEMGEDRLYEQKPMDIDEAVDLLDERKTPFLMFRNIRTEEINVVYPISKGKIGLIEP